MTKFSEMYRRIMATHSAHFNTCFYCGCIATEYDFVPPLKLADFYLTTGEEADFYEVPSCRECFDFLKADKSALLGQRVDVAKAKLSKKYAKAIRVFQLWDPDEFNDFDYNLKTSLNAGIQLGEESYTRVKYKNFPFEVDGQKRHINYVKADKLSVFGEEFEFFPEALAYASTAYRIPKAKLKDLFAEHGNDFDNAIKAFHDEVAEKSFEKQCRKFSKQHRLNLGFIVRIAKLYMKQDDELTLEAALVKLYEIHIKKS